MSFPESPDDKRRDVPPSDEVFYHEYDVDGVIAELLAEGNPEVLSAGAKIITVRELERQASLMALDKLEAHAIDGIDEIRDRFETLRSTVPPHLPADMSIVSRAFMKGVFQTTNPVEIRHLRERGALASGIGAIASAQMIAARDTRSNPVFTDVFNDAVLTIQAFRPEVPEETYAAFITLLEETRIETPWLPLSDHPN
jgi:hypothetical protein